MPISIDYPENAFTYLCCAAA